MGRFFLDTVYGAVFVAIAALVVFVLLPSGKLDIANVFFSVLFGILWGIPLGLVYALGRLILRAAFR